jgi:hypothetical protein
MAINIIVANPTSESLVVHQYLSFFLIYSNRNLLTLETSKLSPKGVPKSFEASLSLNHCQPYVATILKLNLFIAPICWALLLVDFQA